MACKRAGRWLGGCRFEPVYNVTPPSMKGVKGPTKGLLALFDSLSKRDFIGMACTRCGHVQPSGDANG